MGIQQEQIQSSTEAAYQQEDNPRSSIWANLVCVVDSVNYSENTVERTPTTQAVVDDGLGNVQYVTMPRLVDVPLLPMKGGGFLITVPVSVGDYVFVSFSSRCIDGWWESGQITPPADIRWCDLSDGFAYAGPCKKGEVSGWKENAINIKHIASGTEIILESGKITLKSTNVEIEATNTKITGNAEILGNLTVQGGVITNTPAGLIPLNNHKHQLGGNITGTPQ